MVCRERAEKELLIRVVKNKNGDITPDKDGKMPGRGAYICPDEACLAAAHKARRLEKAFSCQIPDAVYAQLEEALQTNDG